MPKVYHVSARTTDGIYAKIRTMPKNKGFGLLEIVIASAIVAGTIFSLSFVFLISHKLAAESSNKVRANFLAEEGLEAMRLLRDQSWSANLAGLNAGTNYYLSFVPPTSIWGVGVSSSGLIDNLFERIIAVEDVNRDPATDDIVTTDGVNDPDTKKINVSVSWSERSGMSTITVSTYLTDMFDN